MGKDLRSTPVPLKIHRMPKMDGSQWSMKTMQPFFPSLEKLFKTENLSNLREYGVKLSSPMESVAGPSSVRLNGREVEIHRKTTMILSPFKTMRGDYGSFGVPSPTNMAEDMQSRLQSPHTAAYVGAMTSIALSESGCQHFPKVYGVFVGMAGKHTVDISDDYEDLSEKNWFADNIGKTFELKLRTGDTDAEFTHTRSQRVALAMGDDADLGEIEDVIADHVSDASFDDEPEQIDMNSEKTSEQDASSDSSDVFEIESCDCSDTDEEGEEEGDESFAWATFTDVPVVTTVMEKCEGTFYDLITEHTEPERHVAWVSQLVFALAYAQRNYGLTHNDLHGNNVMYVKTNEPFLFYKHNGIAYKVPTFGYVMKIIDFDRAILSLKLVGMKESKTFMSNQFQADEEAGGQYNMDPFMDHHHPYIGPSSSFDLVRFATSLFWDLFPEGPDHEYTHPLFAIFKEWMTMPDGTSVMFRKKRDNHDRYHGFDLYKAIVRYCSAAVPRKEIMRMTHYKATPSAAQLGDALLIDT